MSNEQEHHWFWNLEVDNTEAIRHIDEFIAAAERARRTVGTALGGFTIAPPYGTDIPKPGTSVVNTFDQNPIDTSYADNMRRASDRMAQQREALEQIQKMQASSASLRQQRIDSYSGETPNIEMLGSFQRLQVEIAGVNTFLREQYQLLSANAAVSQRIGMMNPAAGRITAETSTFDPANPSDFQLFSDQVKRQAALRQASQAESLDMRSRGPNNFGPVEQLSGGNFANFVSGQGKINESTSVFAQQEGAIQRVRSAMNDLNESVGGVDSRFLHHARAIVELIVIYKGIEMAISTLQQVFQLQAQLSDAAARYSVITGQNTEASQRNVISLQNMAAAYGILPSEVSEGSAGIAQFTKNLEDQQKVASSAAALSRLSGETFAQSVDRLTASLQANNLTAADSGRILDLVLTMYRAVPSTIEEDIQVVEKLGAASERTGMGLEAISVLAARVAQRAATTPTGAANIIERIPGALETQQALQGMIKEGISPFVSGTTQLRPFIDLLTEIAQKYNALNAAGQTSQANRLVESIIGNRPEALRGFVAVLEEINKGMPPILEHASALNTIMDATPAKIDLIKTHWEQLLQAMGKAPATNALLDWIDQAVAHAAQLTELQNKIGGSNTAANIGAALGQGQIGLTQAWAAMGAMQMTATPFQQAQNLTGFYGGLFNPKQAIAAGSAAYHQYDSSNAPDSFEFQNQTTRSMGTTSPYTTGTSGGGTSGGNYLQSLYNSGVGNTQFLSLVNQTALSQSQFNDLQARSIQMTTQQLALWKNYLMSIGFTNDAAEEHLQKLKQQAEVASVLVNVEGRAQLVTGPAANQFSAAYGQMNQQQEGLQRLNFGEQYLPLFDQLVEKFRALLSQVGLDEKGVPTVEAVGKDQVTLLRQSLFYQQASSMALAEIERMSKEHTTGLYNFPRGYTPFVPYQAGDLDVSTRLGQGSGSTGNIKVQPNADVQDMLSPFGTATITFSNATTRFSEAVTRMMSQEDAKDKWLREHGALDPVSSDTGSGTTSGGGRERGTTSVSRRERGFYQNEESPDFGLTAGMKGTHTAAVRSQLSVRIPITYTSTYNILIGDEVIQTITNTVRADLQKEMQSNISEGQSDFGLQR